MSTASDYPVAFGFLAQDGKYYGPNGSVGLYHLGDDRYTPVGTEYRVLGTLLGYTGATGTVGGPHCHSGKWKPGNLPGGYYVAKYDHTYFSPADVFQVGGTVTEVRTQSIGDAGKFVRWFGPDGFTREVFHLSSVSVKVGDKIGTGGNMPDYSQTPTQLDIQWKTHMGSETPADVLSNPDYLRDWRLAQATFWANGGEARYKAGLLPKLECTEDERKFLDLRKKI